MNKHWEFSANFLLSRGGVPARFSAARRIKPGRDAIEGIPGRKLIPAGLHGRHKMPGAMCVRTCVRECESAHTLSV